MRLKNILPYCLVAIGLFQSYRETFLRSLLNADMTSFLLAIQDIRIYGWSYVKTFHFPVPNWLFTVIIPDYVIFLWCKNTPFSLMFIGIVVFWLTALLTGSIIAYVKDYTKGLWATAIVLCAPPTLFGGSVVITNPAAHNVSSLWGLVAVLLSLIYLKKNYITALFLSFFILSLSSFSDPWVSPTFSLPLLCASFLMICREMKLSPNSMITIRPYIGVSLSSVFSIFVSMSHFFGLLKLHAENGHDLARVHPSFKSLVNAFRSISYFFNVVPFADFEKIDWYFSIHNMTGIIFITASTIINAFIFVSLLTVILLTISSFVKTKEERFLCFFSLFSILGIFSAVFIFGNLKDLSSSRYMVNIWYTFIILSLLFIYNNRNSKKILCLGIWFMSVSFLSNNQAWIAKRTPIVVPDQSILEPLKRRNIKYAFSDYWGAEGNSLTLLTNNRIIMHLLSYDRGYHGFLPNILTSPMWYNIPNHERWALVIPESYSEEICPPFPTCEDAAIHQFGSPISIVHEARSTFMIYDSAIVQPANGEISVGTWQEALHVKKHAYSGWQSFFPTGDMNKKGLITIDGWDDVDYNFADTVEKRATLQIPYLGRDEHSDVTIRMKLSSSNLHFKDVDVWYKDKVVAQWRIGPAATVHTVKLPLDRGQQDIAWAFSILNPDKVKHTLKGIRLFEVQEVDER